MGSDSSSTALLQVNDKNGRLANRASIEALEAVMYRELDNEMDEINEEGLIERFVDGAYIRELFIPAGRAIVSRLWNRERFWIITEGKVTVVSDLGKQTFTAPYHGMAPYGSKVALYTHEDTRWFAITGAVATDSAGVEEEVLANNYSELTYPWDKLEHKED